MFLLIWSRKGRLLLIVTDHNLLAHTRAISNDDTCGYVCMRERLEPLLCFQAYLELLRELKNCNLILSYQYLIIERRNFHLERKFFIFDKNDLQKLNFSVKSSHK